MNGISKTAIAAGALILGAHVWGTVSMVNFMDMQSNMMADNNANAEKANKIYAERLADPKYDQAKNDPYFSSDEFKQKIVQWNDGEQAVQDALDDALTETEKKANMFPFSKDSLENLKNAHDNQKELDMEVVYKVNALKGGEVYCESHSDVIKPEEKELGIKYFCS